MNLVICSILVIIDAGGILFQVRENTKGKIIAESANSFLVDFSEGVKGYKLGNKPSDYTEVLVDKNKCVKLPNK